jgi:limonene 1,2-monooxygenase
MSNDWPLRFGVAYAPIHNPRVNPNTHLHRDVEQIVRIEELGFDEVWVGEHHSTGYEIIGSPEVFLAYVAARTSRIKLATGVISVPYHHPFMVCERMVLLDHLSRGRAIMGLGPGALPSDVAMWGIDPMEMRPRLEQGLEAIMALLRYDERVNMKTDWFELTDAALHVQPFQEDGFEIVVTALTSAAGPALAGRFGVSMLSLSAADAKAAGVLGRHWEIVEEQSAEHGTAVSRRNWRLAGPMHIAETEEEARRDVLYGMHSWRDYRKLGPLAAEFPRDADPDRFVDYLVNSGAAVIGTPEQAVEQIRTIQELSGGFGCFCLWAHDWATNEATMRSYELFAHEVMPAFQKQTRSTIAAEEWLKLHAAEGFRQATAARVKATAEYEARQAAKHQSEAPVA